MTEVPRVIPGHQVPPDGKVTQASQESDFLAYLEPKGIRVCQGLRECPESQVVPGRMGLMDVPVKMDKRVNRDEACQGPKATWDPRGSPVSQERRGSSGFLESQDKRGRQDLPELKESKVNLDLLEDMEYRAPQVPRDWASRGYLDLWVLRACLAPSGVAE